MPTTQPWSEEAANAWYAGQSWPVGCNFTPSTASNQLEFWQAETFDPQTIERELGWAEAIGFNTLRVFLHDLAWETDPAGFLGRLDRFLDLASRRRILPLLVFFDDCWNSNPQPGPQPAPIPGVHNSRWLQSPGVERVNDPASWGRLEDYLQAVMGEFGRDERVLGWDLYNEPGNSKQGAKSLPFLRQVFAWARAAAPTQPITCGVWFRECPEMNAFQVENSDVISFHHYGPLEELKQVIAELRPFNRPLLCTEYMSRGIGSLFATHLPLLRAENIGCYNWGLVAGKTQTHYPWGSKENDPDPELWFHEIFYPDGRPYRVEEVEIIKRLSR
jgi:hypothetical protein